MDVNLFIEELLEAAGKANRRFYLTEEYIRDGCDCEEIEQIMREQHVDFLPELYRRFLIMMGRGIPNVFRGSDYTCRHLGRAKQAALEGIADNNPSLDFPEDAFVFISHQGYSFFYFRTADRNEDPEIYALINDGLSYQKVADKLSEFFLNLGMY